MVFAANVNASGGFPSRAGRSPGRRRPASVPRRLRPNPKSYFVILSESDRRTQRAQRPLADYAEQGGERQTKYSQESMTNDKESDSSSIFRSPQNDKTGRTAIRTTRWDRTIHCSQTPRQTGIYNWRQRRLKSGNWLFYVRFAEKSGFSRASRILALRRLAEFTNPRS